MDFVVAQILFIFLPGIIWSSVDSNYGTGHRSQNVQLILRSFLFGVATYSVLFLIYSAIGREFGYSTLGNNSSQVDLIQLKDEIAWSIPLSLVLSVLWLWMVRHRLLMRCLQFIRATNRYGDEDVWSFTLNFWQANVEYVHFRDLEYDLVFAGWVATFSEDEDYRELLLRDAIVYNADGTEITQSPYLYISRPKNNIWMEFPFSNQGDANDR